MKSYKPIYVQRLLLAALFWALSSTSMAVENPALLLLKQNYVHQKLTRQLNKATALALESCLCQGLVQHSPAKASCQKNLEIQSFTRKFYGITGNMIQVENSCQQLVEDLLHTPIREKYEQMKIDLALSNSLKDDNILLVEYDTDNALKLQVHPQHPFKAPLINKSWTGLPIESLTALDSVKNPQSSDSETELSKALKEFNQFRDGVCRAHFLSLQHTDEEKRKNIELCVKLAKHGFRGLSIEERLLARGLTYRLRAQRLRFQKDKFSAYMKAVTESPILLMVKSATPTDEELLDVIRAQKSFKSDITLTIEALDKAKALDADKLFDLSYQIGSIPDTVMIQVKKKYPEVKNWDQIKIELENKFAEKTQNDRIGTFLWNAAILTACTMATGGSATIFCVAGLITLSAGQLIVDFKSYQSTLFDIAATVDRDAYAESSNDEKLMDQMTDMRLDALAAVLMGTNAVKHIKDLPLKDFKTFIRGIL